MIDMGTAGDRGSGWRERGRRIAASPAAPAVAGAVLGLAALTEAIARGAGTRMSVVSLAGVSALALFTAVPLAFLGPAAAAVAICAASVLSIAAFQTLTVAGLIALLVALYRLGRSGASRSKASGNVGRGPKLHGMRSSSWRRPWPCRSWCSRWPAAGARARRKVSSSCCWPRWPRRPPWAGSPCGPAARRWCTARPGRSSRAPCSSTRLAGSGRGSPASCTTWSPHHISMIAVQAETARLATPGMPAAGLSDCCKSAIPRGPA